MRPSGSIGNLRFNKSWERSHSLLDGIMTRPSDSDRVLQVLANTDGLSNRRIKTELNLSDERYSKVRDELIGTGLIEKYVCQGGGIRLTRKGDREGSVQSEISSAFEKEADLYEHLKDFLVRESTDDGTISVILETHSLRARGRWQNPDLTRISIVYFKHLRRSRVSVTTYEVKQFPNWNVSAVYEAASHQRFCHQAYVVLEWPKEIEFSATDPTYKLDQIVRECRRQGVGLATMEAHYHRYILRTKLEPNPPPHRDEDVDEWLEYVFSRNDEAKREFDAKFDSAFELEGKSVAN
jgi:predicted transcriptional regulator